MRYRYHCAVSRLYRLAVGRLSAVSDHRGRRGVGALLLRARLGGVAVRLHHGRHTAADRDAGAQQAVHERGNWPFPQVLPFPIVPFVAAAAVSFAPSRTSVARASVIVVGAVVAMAFHDAPQSPNIVWMLTVAMLAAVVVR